MCVTTLLRNDGLYINLKYQPATGKLWSFKIIHIQRIIGK